MEGLVDSSIREAKWNPRLSLGLVGWSFDSRLVKQLGSSRMGIFFGEESHPVNPDSRYDIVTKIVYIK
jgi:hypothetical protein